MPRQKHLLLQTISRYQRLQLLALRPLAKNHQLQGGIGLQQWSNRLQQADKALFRHQSTNGAQQQRRGRGQTQGLARIVTGQQGGTKSHRIKRIANPEHRQLHLTGNVLTQGPGYRQKA